MNVQSISMTAAGHSAPIAILGQSLAGNPSASPVTNRYLLQPTVFVSFSAATGTAGLLEITFDQPDASGNWPSPGHWVRYPEDFGYIDGTNGNSPRATKVTIMFTGVRLNVAGVAAGDAITLAVVQ